VSSKRKAPDIQKHDVNMRTNKADASGLAWYPPTQMPMQLCGFAWYEQDRAYRRMPLKPSHKLPQAVDNLANCTAGGQIRFQTNSTKLCVRVKLAGLAGMNHMPATGQCGFDCYAGDPGRQKFVNATKYDHTKQEYECKFFELPPEKGNRNITLNFPLYQGVQSVEIGVDENAALLGPPPWQLNAPVVVYGTSITQGGCASRPGMAYTNILSRRLNVEFINLGFSGSGRGEPEVAHVIAGIERPAMLVLDYEGNTGPTFEGLSETMPEFIRILRATHKTVPLLVISRIPFAMDTIDPVKMQERTRKRDFQRDLVRNLRKSDNQIFFHDGHDLLGSNFDECTVDGVHPTDLGFIRMADVLEPVFRTLLS
jgi:hypothetical protein